MCLSCENGDRKRQGRGARADGRWRCINAAEELSKKEGRAFFFVVASGANPEEQSDDAARDKEAARTGRRARCREHESSVPARAESMRTEKRPKIGVLIFFFFFFGLFVFVFLTFFLARPSSFQTLSSPFSSSSSLSPNSQQPWRPSTSSSSRPSRPPPSSSRSARGAAPRAPPLRRRSPGTLPRFETITSWSTR